MPDPFGGTSKESLWLAEAAFPHSTQRVTVTVALLKAYTVNRSIVLVDVGPTCRVVPLIAVELTTIGKPSVDPLSMRFVIVAMFSPYPKFSCQKRTVFSVLSWVTAEFSMFGVPTALVARLAEFMFPA
jgi:hypothetical protein